MPPLEKREYQDQVGFLDSLVGKDLKEIWVHLGTGGQMVSLGRQVRMNFIFIDKPLTVDSNDCCTTRDYFAVAGELNFQCCVRSWMSHAMVYDLHGHT